MKKLSFLIILSILMLTLAVSCGDQVFNGNRTSNDKQFILDYSVLNRTETHEMKLQEGSKINVVVESKSGSVDILVTDSNGLVIYKANNATSGNFLIQIPKSDTYKFSVTGKKARGAVSFKVSD